jgi:subtilase family serine protease
MHPGREAAMKVHASVVTIALLCLLSSGSPTATSAAMTPAAQRIHQLLRHGDIVRGCPDKGARHMRCMSFEYTRLGLRALRARASHVSALDDAIPGLHPSDLQQAYNTVDASTNGGKNVLVAIVVAGDDNHIEEDLAAYRSAFGLPPCVSATGCFRRVNQDGGSALPPDRGWSIELALDVAMVSAMCPNCRIIVVEANDSADGNMAAAALTAVHQGATVVSNSYGDGEYNGEMTWRGYYAQPGVSYTASSGDGGVGPGALIPAAFDHVVAVGGTALRRDSSGGRGWSEVAWAGAGSGCSSEVTITNWQPGTPCGNYRATADISYVASDETPVAAYNGGWVVDWGTSASAPAIAGLIAVSGHNVLPSDLYKNPGNFFDVTSGSNGTCDIAVLCTAGPGWDGPTGLGTPNGVAGL